MRIKLCTILMSLIILLSISTNTAFAAQSISIKIDGVSVPFNDQSGYPFVDENNRTQVPFRATLEAFEAAVEWDGEKQIAIATKNGIKVEVPIGKGYILKNGFAIQNDTKALNKNGRTYLPIRAVMEAFGCTVSWDGQAQAVLIKTGVTGGSLEATTELTPEKIAQMQSYPYAGKDVEIGFNENDPEFSDFHQLAYSLFQKYVIPDSNEKLFTDEKLTYFSSDMYVIRYLLQTTLSDGTITEQIWEIAFLYSSTMGSGKPPEYKFFGDWELSEKVIIK